MIKLLSYDLVKELLDNENFAWRPQPPFIERLVQGCGIFFSNGESWSHQRRLALKTLRDLVFARTRSVEMVETQLDIIFQLLEHSSRSKKSLRVLDAFTEATNGVIAQLALNRQFHRGDKEFEFINSAMKEFFSTPFILSLPLLFPFFDPLIRLMPAANSFNRLDEKYQTMKSLISVRLRWTDQYLQWDPEEFGNTSKIWVYANSIWLPDILISNYADEDYKEIINTNAIVNHEGSVLWMYPMVTKTYCEFDVERFPFDRQTCNVSFFSWTFSSRLLDLRIDETQESNNFYNPKGQEWMVERISSSRELQFYVCCKDDPFPIITYSIHMHRRSLFYVLNLIFPCLLIYCCCFLGFFLPVESGEKVNLEITILLALVVFLIIAGEVLPPTPDVLPLLGMLYGSSMAMVSVALVMAVIVTNLHYAATARPARPVPPLLLRLSRFVLLTCGSRRDADGRRYRRAPHRSATPGISRLPLPAGARNLRYMAAHTAEASADGNSGCWGSGGPDGDCSELAFEQQSATATAPGDVGGEASEFEPDGSEWRIVAKAADRVFFWTFLGITVALLAHMLASAVSSA